MATQRHEAEQSFEFDNWRSVRIDSRERKYKESGSHLTCTVAFCIFVIVRWKIILFLITDIFYFPVQVLFRFNDVLYVR